MKRTLLFLAAGIVVIIIATNLVRKKEGPKSPKQKSAETIQKEHLYTVVCPKDGINIRTGPGTDYSKEESGPLLKGEKLYVLEESEDWVRFRVTPRDVGWSGWVLKELVEKSAQKKKETRPAKQLTQGQRNLLFDLQKQGLVSLEPNLNRAHIDPGLWHQMDIKLKEDFAYCLAIHCGNEKGTQAYWAEIYDKYSGKKLAKYSSWGFNTY